MKTLALIGCYQIVMWIYKVGKAIVRNKPRQSVKHDVEFYDIAE